MDNARRSDWLVLLGAGLLVLGAWLLIERVLGWLFWPLAKVLGFIGHIGWPLVLVGMGVLLIMRAQDAGNGYSGRRLYRSRTDRKVAGVLGGAANYLDMDPSIVRVVYAVLTLLTGFWPGFLLYAVAMAVVPEEQFAAGVQSPPPAPPVPDAPSASSATVAPPAPPAPSTAV